MKTATLQARAVAASLSLVLEFHDDAYGRGLLTYRLLSLTRLLFWLGQVWPVARRLSLVLSRSVDWLVCLFVSWRSLVARRRADGWGMSRWQVCLFVSWRLLAIGLRVIGRGLVGWLVRFIVSWQLLVIGLRAVCWGISR